MKKKNAAKRCKPKHSQKVPVQWEEGTGFPLNPRRVLLANPALAVKDPPLPPSTGTTHFIHAG